MHCGSPAGRCHKIGDRLLEERGLLFGRHYPMPFSDRFLPSILVLLLLSPLVLAVNTRAAQTVTIKWIPNPEPDVAGYRLYYGTSSQDYRRYIDTSTTTAT